MNDEKLIHQPREIGFTVDKSDPEDEQILEEEAAKDAQAHMAKFWVQNGGRKISAPYDVPEAIVTNYVSELRAKMMKRKLNFTEQMLETYETAFRQECALGYPVDIN